MSAALEAAKRLTTAAAKRGGIIIHTIYTPADKVNVNAPKRGVQKAIEVDGVIYLSGMELRRKYGIHYVTLKRWLREGRARYVE